MHVVLSHQASVSARVLPTSRLTGSGVPPPSSLLTCSAFHGVSGAALKAVFMAVLPATVDASPCPQLNSKR